MNKEVVPIHQMCAVDGGNSEVIQMSSVQALKEKVYEYMLKYLQVKKYPIQIRLEEVNVNHLVLYILGPIIQVVNFQNTSRRSIKVQRVMEIVGLNSQTRGYKKFVVNDRISIIDQVSIFVIESKHTKLDLGIRQCLLAMYDIFNYREKGKGYGFVTIGEEWRMIVYDGSKYQMTESFFAVFGEIDTNKNLWIEECWIVAECVLVAWGN